MTDAQLWSLIVGALAPNVIAILTQPKLSSGVRTIIMVAVCTVSAFITAALEDEFNGRSVISSILITIVAAVTFYREVWSRFGVTQAIEAATSPKDQKQLAFQKPYAETTPGPADLTGGRSTSTGATGTGRGTGAGTTYGGAASGRDASQLGDAVNPVKPNDPDDPYTYGNRR